MADAKAVQGLQKREARLGDAANRCQGYLAETDEPECMEDVPP